LSRDKRRSVCSWNTQRFEKVSRATQ